MRVVVVGAGVIGLACAWRLSQRGADVTVLDPAPGNGSSAVAAGMLAPITEAHPTEGPLLALSLAAAERYPAFAGELASVTGIDPLIRTDGTLALALDQDDRAQLAVHAGHLRSLGLVADELTARECRRLEPGLAPEIRGGLRIDGDHSVDPRALLRALTAAGPPVLRARAETVDDAGVLLADGTRRAADVVVIAAGCWSGRLHPALAPLIRPVKGEILRLRARPGAVLPTRTLRATVRGKSVYAVPRADGGLVVGATQLEAGFDTAVTAGGVYELLRDARAILPGLDEFELVECAAGLRPGSPDNAPLIGHLAPGVIAATGHGRNGVLLAGVTADAVAALVFEGALPQHAAVADPGEVRGVITVQVNGKNWLLPEATTLADIVARLSAEPRGLAVALDGAVVPRPRWAGTPVRGGATIEVLTAVQGG